MEERDPQFVEKAVAIMELQLHPPTAGPTFCVDEKTAIGGRAPTVASQAPAPGRPARRAHEYVRHGTADLLATFCANTGVVTGIVRARHRSEECIELLSQLERQVPAGQVLHLILDPVRLHSSAKVTAFLADRPGRFRCHWLPLPSAWLSFIEAWFAILSKKCRKRAELTDFAAAAAWIAGCIATDNAHQAKPVTFKQGVNFYQRLKDTLAERHVASPTALPAGAPALAPAA